MKAEILSAELIASGRYLKLETLRYRDDHGAERLWEAAGRVGSFGAVIIVAKITRTGELVLIRQFRPPAGKHLIEFPAGLVDPGETPEHTAVRELLEETGYCGRVTAVHPPTYSSPGLSGEQLYLVEMAIDDDFDPVPCNEECESIETFRVPPAALAAFLDRCEARGDGVDAKVRVYSLR